MERLAQPNQSLKNGLACLQALAATGRPAGSRELARLLNIEHTKVNRMLGTLASLGLAERTPDRKYQPGPGIHVLAAQALKGSGLMAAALPHLRELEKEKFSIGLGVLWRGRVCYITFSQPGEPVEAGIGSSSLFPAAHSTIGRPQLAARSEQVLSEAIAAAKEMGRPISKAELKRELKKVRELGYALRYEEDGRTISSIGVAVGSPPLAGLALTGKIAKRSVPRLVKQLQSIDNRITADLQNKK